MNIFSNKKASTGKLTKLKNKKKARIENEYYYALWVQHFSSGCEECLLFSDSDLTKIKEITDCDFENFMESGYLYRLDQKGSFYIRMKGLDEVERLVRINTTVYNNGVKRADKNPEDIPEKGFFQDLFD